jgi:2-polyprenyl-3-methyl-5-hydroxy-6-metoxy-1,4-benzoquinol methylase
MPNQAITALFDIKKKLKNFARRKSFMRTSGSDTERTIDHWSENLAGSEAFSPKVYWLAIPEVQIRHQSKATQGKANNWVDYFLESYFGSRIPVERMASIGCGTGTLERHLAHLNAFSRCDAFDISPAAIDVAQQLAQKENIESINYEVIDINDFEWPSRAYDAVWFNGSLHHIERLEDTCSQLVKSLKQDGYIFLNEYIGPSRFDFTDRQRQVIKAAFTLIPESMRKSFIPNYPHAILQSAPIPDPEGVRKTDPSEAVRSAEIMEILQQYFDIVEYNEMGGTILQFLLSGIAGNFQSADLNSMQALNMLFTIEDTLIEIGDIQSDFACIAAKLKQ